MAVLSVPVSCIRPIGFIAATCVNTSTGCAPHFICLTSDLIKAALRDRIKHEGMNCHGVCVCMYVCVFLGGKTFYSVASNSSRSDSR